MMDELKSVLAEFFGGPWDGNRREVMAGGHGYRIPLEGVPPTMGGSPDALPAVPTRTEIHIYTRRNRLSKGGYVVFEYEGTKR